MSTCIYTSASLSLIALLMTIHTYAAVRLPQLIGDHMVLQRETIIPVWGWADRKEKVTVSFMGKKYTVLPDASGKWTVTLPPMPAGGPHEMIISGKNTIHIHDILIGDVWIGSGQSNMEWNLKQQVNNSQQEIAQANFPEIRLFDVKNTVAYSPVQEIKSAGWQVCSPVTVADFSAVAYFFGRNLHSQYKIPIGLITADWGGTPIEAWTSGEALKGFQKYKPIVASIEQHQGDPNKIRQEYNQNLALWQKEFIRLDSGYQQNDKTWADPEIDDSFWPTMDVPAPWEQPGLMPEFDGIVWFRKAVIIPPSQAGKPITLRLSTIDDVDTTWFNGVRIGFTGQYNLPREYRVPGHLVKAGRNIISVRVLDTGSDGGIRGKAEEMVLIRQDSTLSLAGKWAYRPALHIHSLPYIPVMNSGQYAPTLLYNGMIAPLIPYAIKGVIWYQGENNANRAYQYRDLFPALIRDWRKHWGYDFPFIFVQLSAFKADKDQPADYDWAELREAQTMTLSLPRTGMAVTIDIGDPADIHPRNKQDVGKRLALEARRVAYVEKDLVSCGPMMASMEIKGNQVKIRFTDVGTGLQANDKYGYVRGFAVAGADKKFVWAKAYIEGNEVVVSAEEVQHPVAVRYNWGNSPDGNLYNSEHLPAVPFRTDNWPGITYGKH